MPQSPITNVGFVSSLGAELYPNRIAIIESMDGIVRQISYSELETRLNQVALLLQERGIKPGEKLAVAIGNRIEFIEAIFGAMRAGIVPVPINIRLGPSQLEYILKDSECVGAIYEPGCNPHLKEVIKKAGLTRTLVVGDAADTGSYATARNAMTGEHVVPNTQEVDLAMLPYTSGSTGMPKGVALTHKGQGWFLDTYSAIVKAQYGESPRVLVAVPLFHKNAMACAVKPMLSIGGTLVILNKFEAESFVKALVNFKCNYATGVPAMYAMILKKAELLKNREFPDLVNLYIGSAPCAVGLLQRIEIAFKVPVIQGYGLTEGGPVVFSQPAEAGDCPRDSCGVSLPGIDVQLMNENRQPDPRFGELWVRNPGVTPGYHNLPEVNRDRLVDGWLRTGDLFERDDDGYYFFRGRTDDMFICGGENIYPLEVENILLMHKDVVLACVVSADDETKGQVPVAMVVKQEGSAVNEANLKKFCLDMGPAYSHPRKILIVDNLPVTGAGKVDRRLIQLEMS